MPSPKVASEKLIARRKAKVIMNRAALDAAVVGMADGLLEVGQRIIARAAAAAPRDPEKAAARGVPMMADTGHVVVYAGGKKVGGEEGGTGKPRGMRTAKGRADMGVWFSSPIAHFAELGTIKETARPFLLPAFNAEIAGASATVTPAMGKRIKAVPG